MIIKRTNKDKVLSVLYKLIRKIFLRVLMDTTFIKIDYFLYHRKFLNLHDPDKFSEKIQWIKLYGGLEKYTRLVDKIEVRKYVSRVIGKEYLIPVIGIWNNVNDIPFDALPDQFVIKATHGSHYVYICDDKSKIKQVDLEKIITKWLHESFYMKTREPQYKNCRPRIICEKYLGDGTESLPDYRIFCSEGKPKIIEIEYWTTKKRDVFIDIYKDIHWNTLNIYYDGVPRGQQLVKRPKNLKLLLTLAKKLSKNIPFVRVDLYSTHNHVYFGELTFTPGNGTERFAPPEAEYLLGGLIDLRKYK